MKTITQATPSQIRNFVRASGQTQSIQIGRSYNVASAGTGTPIEFVDGDSAPILKGQPFLKTTFRRGNFSKILYTPSTLFIEVGRNWSPE